MALIGQGLGVDRQLGVLVGDVVVGQAGPEGAADEDRIGAAADGRGGRGAGAAEGDVGDGVAVDQADDREVGRRAGRVEHEQRAVGLGLVGGTDGQGLGIDRQLGVLVGDVVVGQAGPEGAADEDRIGAAADGRGGRGAGAAEGDVGDGVAVDQADDREVGRRAGRVEHEQRAVGLGLVGGTDGQGLGIDRQLGVLVGDVVVGQAGPEGAADEDRIGAAADGRGGRGAGAAEGDVGDGVAVDQADDREVGRRAGRVEHEQRAVGLGLVGGTDRSGPWGRPSARRSRR